MNFEQLGKNVNSFLSSSKILNNLPDMVLFIDSEGRIKESNIAAKNNLNISENITINELFNEGLKIVRQSIKNKKAIIAETKTPNTYYEITASKIDNNYCVCIRDNTKIINENIEKKGIEKFNNEKNAMLVKLENEFKSPISSITGFCQGLVDGIGGEITEKQSKYLKIIQSNAIDLEKFIGTFLGYSYAESLLYQSDYRKFDIVTEIKEILKEFNKTINTDKIKIEFSYDNIESRNESNDYKAIKNSVINILENILASKETGNIQIILTEPDDETFITYSLNENKKYFQIKIIDSNISITPDELKQICNPYTQLDKNKKNIIKSLRLGTASILVKRAGGFFNISADNRNLYSIIIPVEKEEDE